MLLFELIKFFGSIFSVPRDTFLGETWYTRMTSMTFTIGGTDYNLVTYMTLTCSYISLIIIIILCALFVYKIIKLIGGLIR